MKSVYTGIYRLDIRKHNSDIAHMYEHLLIRSFENHISQKGFSLSLYGWLHGETFRDMCFLEYGFYSSDVRDLFSQFMTSKNKIDLSLLDSELDRIEAEERSIVTTGNRNSVLKAIRSINNDVWIDLETTAPDMDQIRGDGNQRDDDIVRFKKSAKSFRDISIVLGIQNASIEEKALLLRTLPIIYDTITRSTYELGFYERDSSPLRYQEEYDAMVACMIFSIKRGTYSTKKIKNKIQQIIYSFDLTGHEAELSRYTEAYIHTPLWNSFPIEYYKYSGMLVSKMQIAQLVTTDDIGNLLKKLTVNVVPTVASHYAAFQD